ncbi:MULTISPECIES: hypothetical protein [unclassified Bradyrhizobium]
MTDKPATLSIDPAEWRALFVENVQRLANFVGQNTHRIRMPRSTMRRMQIVGAYRDVELGQPTQPRESTGDLAGLERNFEDRGILAVAPSGKTRLIEFGHHAAAERKKRGVGRPETLFLDFTFICGKSRRGAFQLQRKTRRDRMRAKLREIKAELRQRMHQSIPSQGHWLRQVVTGHFAYYAVPTNSRAPSAFGHYVADVWRRTLRRRGQKDGFTWDRMTKLVASWLPAPRILHPWPDQRLRHETLEVRAGCANRACPDLCGVCPATGIPTAIQGPLRT